MTATHRFLAPCLFGLEGIAAAEFRREGFAEVEAADGRVYFTGDLAALAKANIRSRYTERILLEIGAFRTTRFDDLFEQVRALPWEDYIPKDAAFPVDGYSLRSQLKSVPDCQRIIKKAVVSRLQDKYHLEWFAETGAKHQLRFSLLNDECSVCLDSSGEGLHKRGYRAEGGEAPLRETLACAMVDLSRYRGQEAFLDPFCGSGTIAIEAALKASNRAPGQNRRFAAEDWGFVPRALWDTARQEAADRIFREPLHITGRDIDPAGVALARENAKKAGVGELVRFEVADATKTPLGDFEGAAVTNPPYGQRLSDAAGTGPLYAGFGRMWGRDLRRRLYLLTADENFERHFGRRAQKKRKLYNGMIPCTLYMYFQA